MDIINAKRKAPDESPSPEYDSEIPEVKRLRESLLDDDSDSDTEFYTTSLQDLLVLFMKTFEEEITNSPAPEDDFGELGYLLEDSDDDFGELGYLLEASDDDLGIPPTIVESVGPGAEFRPFDGEFSSFNSFGLDQTDGLR